VTNNLDPKCSCNRPDMGLYSITFTLRRHIALFAVIIAGRLSVHLFVMGRNVEID